jgi:Tetracyclin repressor-like, C-terminal domain
VELVESKLQLLLDAPLNVTISELVKAVIAAHAINPRLHQVLNEEIPRSARLQQMQKADERIGKMMRAYLSQCQEYINSQNLDMTVFILNRTVESLCHAAVIEQPNFVSNSYFEQEVTNLLLLYLKSPHHRSTVSDSPDSSLLPT